ncbi:MAG: bifunctional pyr operon transcriptional regulator/uracil phosphoribosyltransferase PyrR [Candidatus Omnitrophica bacterium]|nr:bifunctional pyr operon transcriptional regulator/uracil phosphoribosyltransferase PyrR [Candidatus Omnitrophota bacterium]
MKNNNTKIQVMDAQAVDNALKRMAHEIVERNQDASAIAIVGIRTRGEYLAERLSLALERITGNTLTRGVLDITLYRDDLMISDSQPVVRETDLSFDVSTKHIVLVDDVLYTGRTIRAALDAFIDFGRPKSIQLAILVDRGHRELPIRADYVGKNIPTSATQVVRVKLKEKDGVDEVCVFDGDLA